MTLDVYHGRATTIQQQSKYARVTADDPRTNNWHDRLGSVVANPGIYKFINSLKNEQARF